MNVVITPFRRTALRIAPARCRQLQHQSRCRLAKVDAALRHVHIELVFGRAALQHHRNRAFLQETVRVGLHRSRHAHRLCPYAVPPHAHACRGRCRVIRHEVEQHLLILACVDSRGEMVCRKDAPVLEGYLGSYIWSAAAGLQYIEIDALALQCQFLACLHLGHHLHGMPADSKPGHGERETTVGRTAPRDRNGIFLYAVHIEGDGLCTASAYGIGYAHILAHAITTLCNALGNIETARQCKRHRLHAYIALLGLRLACGRIGGGGLHIDVSRAQKEVFRQVQRIGALAHVLLRIGIHQRRAAFHLYLHRGFLPRRCPLLVTAAVLVVVEPCECGLVAFLDDGLVCFCRQHDFGGGGFSATAAFSCRYVQTYDLRTTLVGQRHTHGALVIAQFGTAAEYGVGFDLCKFGGHGRVLHRIGGVRVQALVHLCLVDGEVHVARAVKRLFLSVYRNALHVARTAEVLPARHLFPTVKARADELFGLPLALCRLVGDAASLGTFLLLHGNNGGRQCVVTTLKRDFLCHVAGVSATAACGIFLPFLRIMEVVAGVTGELPGLPAVRTSEYHHAAGGEHFLPTGALVAGNGLQRFRPVTEYALGITDKAVHQHHRVGVGRCDGIIQLCRGRIGKHGRIVGRECRAGSHICRVFGLLCRSSGRSR